MPDDHPYVEENTRERERLRALVESLDEDALRRPVNEYWTVERGDGTVAEPRLYQLVRQRGQVSERTFEIVFHDPGVEVFAFTFG